MPVTCTLLAECLPSGRRGSWCVPWLVPTARAGRDLPACLPCTKPSALLACVRPACHPPLSLWPRRLAFVQIFWGIGAMLMSGIAWAVLPTLGFRWLVGLSVSPAVLCLCLCWLTPESPYWLHQQGR